LKDVARNVGAESKVGHNADIIHDIFQDRASACTIQADGESKPRAILAVFHGRSTGKINPRNKALAFVDNSALPAGADWEYGLIMAADAPEGMAPDTRLTIVDQAVGRVLTCEAAEPVYDLDLETRERFIVAWRLALRGKQRMGRGR
jgi:hypothetical protein